MDDPDPGSALPLLVGEGRPLEFLVLCLSLAAVIWAVAARCALRNFRWKRLEKIWNPEAIEDAEATLQDDQGLLDSLLVVRLIASIVAILLIVAELTAHPELLMTEQPLEFLSNLAIVVLVFLIGIHGIVRGLVRAAPERVLIMLLPSVRFADRIVLPVRWLLDTITSGCARLLGIRKAEEDQAREEILDAVSEGEREGAIDDDEREMIESIIEFRDMAVSEIMTPRISVFGLEVTTPLDDAVRAILDKGHSRVPVFEAGIDNVRGILYAKDVLSLWERRADEVADISSLLRKPLYVPETKSISELLKELRRTKIHMAVVLDEYGGVAGVVTIEDILEEIVGEIEDEYDQEADGQPLKLNRINEHEAEVSARIDVEELNEALQIEIPDEDSYETLGGFLFTQLGRVPEVGEQHQFQNVRFEVLDADERRINRVRVVVG